MNIILGKIYKNKNYEVYVIPYKIEDEIFVHYRRLDNWDISFVEVIIYFNRLYIISDEMNK